MSQAVVDQLFGLARGHTTDLAEDALPTDTAGGLALQLAVLDRWQQAGETLAGWKVAFTAGPSRQFHDDGALRPFGHILGDRVFPSGSEIDIRRIPRCVLEPEICLTLGASLAGADVTPEQARAAVAAVAPAFELNSVRLPGRPLPLLMADNLAQWGIVVGAERPVAQLDVDAMRVTVDVGDERVAEQVAAGHLDDPWRSLAQLCTTLDHFGRRLEAGQRILTGAFSMHEVAAPGRWTAVFQHLGPVEVTFA